MVLQQVWQSHQLFHTLLTEAYLGISNVLINPSSNDCPKAMIKTDISDIDTMNSVVRDQNITIFSINGLPINKHSDFEKSGVM